MFVSIRDHKNLPVRVFMDTGCDTPIMLKQWADSHAVLLRTRMEPKTVENFNRERVEEARSSYTFCVTLRYESNYAKETFQISLIEDLSDIILPYWWIV
jgi:hypothetical protein